MKLKKTIGKYYSSDVTHYQYYKNNKGFWYSSYNGFWTNGHNYWDGYRFNGAYIGVWKWWYDDGTRWWIDTSKNSVLNGVKIDFNYEK